MHGRPLGAAFFACKWNGTIGIRTGDRVHANMQARVAHVRIALRASRFNLAAGRSFGGAIRHAREGRFIVIICDDVRRELSDMGIPGATCKRTR